MKWPTAWMLPIVEFKDVPAGKQFHAEEDFRLEADEPAPAYIKLVYPTEDWSACCIEGKDAGVLVQFSPEARVLWDEKFQALHP